MSTLGRAVTLEMSNVFLTTGQHASKIGRDKKGRTGRCHGRAVVEEAIVEESANVAGFGSLEGVHVVDYRSASALSWMPQVMVPLG